MFVHPSIHLLGTSISLYVTVGRLWKFRRKVSIDFLGISIEIWVCPRQIWDKSLNAYAISSLFVNFIPRKLSNTFAVCVCVYFLFFSFLFFVVVFVSFLVTHVWSNCFFYPSLTIAPLIFVLNVCLSLHWTVR